MSRHTRGPWATEPHGTLSTHQIFGPPFADGIRRLIAQTVPVDVTPAEHAANAALIAAAPELLEACKAVLAHCTCEERSCPTCSTLAPIAKATGQ